MSELKRLYASGVGLHDEDLGVPFDAVYLATDADALLAERDETIATQAGAMRVAIAEGKAQRERIAELERECSRITWLCFDCGSRGPFRTKKYGSPIEGEDFDVVCAACASANTGEPSDSDGEDMADTIAAQREEIERLNQTQAVCHCGDYMKDHHGYDGHSPLDMIEGPCPDPVRRKLAEDNAALRAENAELRERVGSLEAAAGRLAGTSWVHERDGINPQLHAALENLRAALTPPEPQEADDGE